MEKSYNTAIALTCICILSYLCTIHHCLPDHFDAVSIKIISGDKPPHIICLQGAPLCCYLSKMQIWRKTRKPESPLGCKGLLRSVKKRFSIWSSRTQSWYPSVLPKQHVLVHTIPHQELRPLYRTFWYRIKCIKVASAKTKPSEIRLPNLLTELGQRSFY